MVISWMLSGCGVLLTLACAYILSLNPSGISWRYLVQRLMGLVVWAIVLVKTPLGDRLLEILENSALAIQRAAHDGISFVFGDLGSNAGQLGFVFAFQVLPVVIFFSALVSALSYLGIIQFVVHGLGMAIRPVLGTSAPETAVAVAKSFLGLIEGPLVIRTYFTQLNRSELFTVMVAALGMVSAAMFPVYISYGMAAKHLIAANLMGIIAVILVSKIIVPEEKQAPQKKIEKDQAAGANNVIDALILGTRDGLTIALSIGALLIAFIACVSALNMIFFAGCDAVGISHIGLQDLVGYIFWPFGYLFGIDAAEALKVGRLLGVKITTNEILAFAEVASHHLSDRAQLLVTYALCGFGNIAGMGIVVGGLGALMPDKHILLSQLSWRALAAATLANLLSAYIVGILL